MKIPFEGKEYELEYEFTCFDKVDAVLVLTGDTELKNISGEYIQFLRPQVTSAKPQFGYNYNEDHERNRNLKQAIADQISRL